ncbi:RING finger protein 10 [Operophtera brumata]|uniref:RING finger protein 10 n=1 Tax=Operophtera brumata TaxID=104452 RepID=A0A0L7K4I2_OPEBR|nr:RING finger protein 10 [Operophtera brumata]
MEPQDGWRSGELGALENSNRTRDAERDRVRIEFYATYDVMTERRGSSVVCALPERRLSPCPSERLAPLASVSSVGPSFVLECDLASIGADSVFVEDSDSTDDEVEQFSTDSGGGEAAATGECTELSSRPAPRPLRVDHTSHSRETLF